MQGRIGFEGLHVQCIIGKEPHERQEEQDLFIDIMVEAAVDAAAATDDLERTIDYVALATLCKAVAIHGRYYLLERLAGEIAAAVLQQFPALSVTIRIKKPKALADASCAVVEMSRRK